jgi:sugar/nucleoside kinase (ribokinase family)
VKLICAGEAFEDLIFVGLSRLPELGEEIKTDRFESTIGGGAVITPPGSAWPPR